MNIIFKIISWFKKDENTRIVDNFDYHLNEFVENIARLMRGKSYFGVIDTSKKYFLERIESGDSFEEATTKAIDYASELMGSDYKFGIQKIASEHKQNAIKGLCKITKVKAIKEEKQHIIV